MSTIELLKDLSGSIGTAAAEAPDEYPDWGFITYESNRADIIDLWSKIRPRLRQDIDKITFIDAKLVEAFAALDAGDKEVGRKAMWVLYNLRLPALR
jgi:hypothetical protein